MRRKMMLFLTALCMVIFINAPVHAAESIPDETPLVQQFTHGIGGS